MLAYLAAGFVSRPPFGDLSTPSAFTLACKVTLIVLGRCPAKHYLSSLIRFFSLHKFVRWRILVFVLGLLTWWSNAPWLSAQLLIYKSVTSFLCERPSLGNISHSWQDTLVYTNRSSNISSDFKMLSYLLNATMMFFYHRTEYDHDKCAIIYKIRYLIYFANIGSNISEI